MNAHWAVGFASPTIVQTRHVHISIEAQRCTLHRGSRTAQAAVRRASRPHTTVEAKKSGGGAKRKKRVTPGLNPKPESNAQSQSNASSPVPITDSATGDTKSTMRGMTMSTAEDNTAEDNNAGDISDDTAPAFPGPFSPELLQLDDPVGPTDETGSASTGSQEDYEEEDTSENLTVDDDSTLKLPDLSSRPAIRRKRKPLSTAKQSKQQKSDVRKTSKNQDVPFDGGEIDSGDKSQFNFDRVRELATAYRLNDPGRQTLIDEIEKDPDFVFRTGQKNEGEYDLTSAMFGTGKPNKQGVYVLPSLQSAHIVLLGISILTGFVYFPGFPLTESSDEVRLLIKTGLGIVLVVNSVLAYLAWKSATKRAQPPWFWAAKTLVLGELAFGELRRNTKILSEKKKKKQKSKSRKQ